jgi:D-alanine-D-alanine ligase
MTKKKTVAILYGGRSVEHAVSVNSARNIVQYIDRLQFEPIPVGITQTGKWFMTDAVSRDIEKGEPLGLNLDTGKPCLLQTRNNKPLTVDIVFPVLHGTDVEDGSVQGMIKAVDLPLVGTGVLGSSLSMNKIVAKRLLSAAGLPVTSFEAFHYSEKKKITFSKLSRKLGLPFMVKAASLGSSVGITKVKQQKDFGPAIAEAFKYDDEILVEKFVKGREIECAVLGNNPPKASNPGEIIISKSYEFYTFDAKYVDPKAVQIAVPALLPKTVAERIRKISVQAYQTLHCEDFARVDLFVDADKRIYINEINTIPGFTNSSMYPMMWKERGLSFTDLITKLLNLAQERYDRGKRVARDFQSNLTF